jgi:hypothetical protein
LHGAGLLYLNGNLMIIVPRKFIYVGSIRTGSHFIYDTLMEHFPGAIRTTQHHELIPELLEAKRAHRLPLYTVVRDPLYVLYSLWRTFLKKYPHLDPEKYATGKPFDEWLETKRPFENGKAPYDPTEQFPPGYLIFYRHVADMFFPFEPNFSTFFNFVGLNGIIESEPKEVDVAELSEEAKNKIRTYFADDYMVYDHKLFRPDKVA